MTYDESLVFVGLYSYRSYTHMPPTRHVLHPAVCPDLVQRLFAPLKKAVPDARFHSRADYRRRTLDAASIIIALVFMQMRRLSSLRALVDALDASSRIRSVLGLAPIRRSTLADALSGRQKKRPDKNLLDFVERLFNATARDATRRLGNTRSTVSAFLAVDGTVFSATAKMIFARFDRQRNALKAHVAFAVTDYVPKFITLTKAITAESGELRKKIREGRTYILDRGYVGFDLFRAIKNRRARFITRSKKGMICVAVKQIDISDEDRRRGILRDEIVHVDDKKLRLRRVAFRADDGRCFEYLTNHFDLTALEIADLYKSRWAVETFFKFLKHSLVTRHLISRTLIGFHIQLYAAAIAYLLFAIEFGPNKNGRPPVSLSQMRRLADRLLEEIIIASLRFHPPHDPQQAPSRDPTAIHRAHHPT
jgi:Transposase DDE domain